MRLRKLTDTSNISKAGVGWTTCSLMEMCQQPRNLVHLLWTAGMSRWFSLGGGVCVYIGGLVSLGGGGVCLHRRFS